MSTALRVRWTVGRYGPTLVALLLLLGVLGLGTAAWAYTQPQYETTTAQEFPQAVGASVETSAVVTGNSSLYERGEHLEDRPAYLLSASPNATLSIDARVPDGVQTRLDEQLVLELTGTKDGEEFWRDTRVLINRTRRVNASAPNTSVTLNVSRLDQELAAVREEVGRIGVFQSRLRLVVAYSTNRYSGTLTAAAPLQITDRAYWIDGSLSAEESRTTTVTERVQTRPDPATYLGPGLAGLLAFLVGGVVWVRYREVDLTSVETAISRSRYTEWISSGEFPSGPNKRHIRINDLEGLVDVAIDSNKRVIYDESYGAYAVADGDLVYYFAENPDRVEAWLDI
jgi:hypothetical protein